jgi:hypothetical protein
MLEESSGSVCGLVKPLIRLILCALFRSTSEISIHVLTDMIGCSEDSDLRKLVLKWQ